VYARLKYFFCSSPKKKQRNTRTEPTKFENMAAEIIPPHEIRDWHRAISQAFYKDPATALTSAKVDPSPVAANVCADGTSPTGGPVVKQPLNLRKIGFIVLLVIAVVGILIMIIALMLKGEKVPKVAP
jgi:hypothetical protein